MVDAKTLNDDEYQENIYLVSPPNDEYNEWNEYVMMAGALSLCILLSISLILYYVFFRMDSHAEVRRRQRPRISRTRLFSLRGGGGGGGGVDHFFCPATDGLRREVVDALPVFFYKPENFNEGLSCAVCLSEFEENEKAKLLPTCNHSFHVECVNMWFYSHSTCPLCRANVEKQSLEISVLEEEEEGGGGGGKAGESTGSGEERVECINGDNNCVSIDVPQMEKEEK